jgi:hypothetical protein
MARVWIEDRVNQADYQEAVARAKKSKRKAPGRYRVRWYDHSNNDRMKTFEKKVDASDYRTQVEIRLGDGSYRDPAAGKALLAAVAED